MDEDIRIAIQQLNNRIATLEGHKEYNDKDDVRRDKLLNDIMLIVTAIKTKQDNADGKKDGISLLMGGIWSLIMVIIVSVSTMLYGFHADLAVVKNTLGIK